MKPLDLAEAVRVAVKSDPDIVAARTQGRAMAIQIGFRSVDATLVATAISELARNILLYAARGEIVITSIEQGSRRGLAVHASDDGPGIGDIQRAMQDGWSTSGRLGLGLPGVRRLMDEFQIHSETGRGTRVTVKKWMT